jgi:hypothetical protein
MYQCAMIIVRTLIAFMLAGFLMGCMGAHFKNLGSLEPSASAKSHFEEFAFNSGYNYYIYGSDTYPVLFFGLEKNYILDADEDLWKKIEPKQELMSELVGNMQKQMQQCCLQSPYGFDILDHQGKKIGEWYSMLGLNVGIKTKESGKVIIYPPSDTDDVKKYQGRQTHQ